MITKHIVGTAALWVSGFMLGQSIYEQFMSNASVPAALYAIAGAIALGVAAICAVHDGQ